MPRPLPTSLPPPVLLVEDDGALAALLASHLEAAGFAVTTAASVAQATRHLVATRGEGCAVLVTDQLLPDGRGSDLLRAARGAGVRAPAIFVSAFYPPPPLRAELTEELGVARIVRKPLSPGQLIRIVRELVGGEDLGPQSPGGDVPGRGEPPAVEPSTTAPLLARDTEPPASDGAPLAEPSGQEPPAVPPGRRDGEALQDRAREPGQDPAARLAARLAALRRDYAGAALTQARAALDAWRANQADVPPRALVREVRAVTHRLHGTAGSYGMERVSAVAAEVEALAELLLERLGADTPGEEGVPSDLLVRVGTGLTALVAAVEVAAAPEAASGRGEGSAGGGAVAWSVLLAGLPEGAGAAFRAAAAARQVQVTLARAFHELEAALAAGTFDALVLEYGFGGEDLADTASWLRAACGSACPPLLVLGPPRSLEARVAAARVRADAYLSEPLRIQALVEVLPRLRSCVASRSQGRRRQPVALALDDDVAFLAVLAAMAEHEGVRVEPLQDPRAIFEALERLRPTMVFCDLHMPALSGADVCRMIRAEPAWSHLSVHILTASKDRADRQAALEAGADSVLAKPLVPAELHALLARRARVERELRARDERDTLTGLSLRGPFLDAIWADLPVLAERGAAGSLVLLDVADLRRVDEEHGPLASDEVLRYVGRVLHARCRASDGTCRWTGERFAVWLPLTRVAAARGVAARLAAAVSAGRFVGAEGERFAVRVRVGVATFPAVGPGAEDLLRAAALDLHAGRVVSQDGEPAAHGREGEGGAADGGGAAPAG